MLGSVEKRERGGEREERERERREVRTHPEHSSPIHDSTDSDHYRYPSSFEYVLHSQSVLFVLESRALPEGRHLLQLEELQVYLDLCVVVVVTGVEN